MTASVTLTANIHCATFGIALTITKPSVVLNLNGHTISGDGNGVGVRIISNSDIVENGVVTGFQYGVEVTAPCDCDAAPTSNEITKIRSTYNGADGIHDEGHKTKITLNTVYANSGDGISNSGTTPTVTGNIATSNGQDGISVYGSLAVVSGNTADGNHRTGIVIPEPTSGGTTVTGNTANFNTDDGIVNSSNDAIDGGGNVAKGNDTGTGLTPEQCSAISCN